MKKKRIMASFPIRILAVSIPGLLAGLFLNVTRTMGLTSGALNLVVTARYVLSQIITFLAPLIIIGLVASSIISVKKKAPTPVTAPIVRITYFSMLGAAAFASVLGYLIIPKLPVSTDSLSFRFLPDTLFELPIPAPVSALSALVLAILLALGACWTNAVRTKELLQEFRGITLSLMSRILLPLLPAYIGLSLCTLAYQGYFIKYLPLLLLALIIIIPAYMVWVLVLYHIAGSYAGEKAWGILKNYIPVCKMALRTHSSTAVEKYSQEAADKCVPLDSELIKEAIPLFTQIHHCGSVLAEVFFAMMISRILYGSVPAPGTMVIFSILLATCSIGTPGLPWGTVMVSLGTLTGILKFGDSGVALMFAVFALNDAFAAACNATCDGAAALFLTGYVKRHDFSNRL
ncbi:MAG: cation:dicarboxylate symporter family transporter [Ruminococcus sp.]